MSAAELNQETLADLGSLGRAPRINVLLGAGASAGVGLPDWDTFVVRLLQRSGVIIEEVTARAFLAQQDPQLAVEAARARVRASRGNWEELLRGCLYDPLGSASSQIVTPGLLHLATAALAAERRIGDVGLFTLNYDVLLEEALKQANNESRQRRRVFSRARSAPRAQSGSYEVHHLHGLIEPRPGGRADGVVLALSDYSALESRERPWQVAALQEALQHGPLVLAGTSYRDPDIRRWMDQLTKDTDAPGNVVIVLARQSLGLSRERFAEVRGAVTEQWSAIGVDVVLVHDHADAAQALREVPALRRPAYRAPQQRAEYLTQRLHADFERLQREHAAQLDADLEGLRVHLGRDANLTLWLADGQGDLIRWAANDRIYRGWEHLRRVPSGHDSPWLAGRCLATDDVIVRELRDAEGTRRWRSIVAAPVIVGLLDAAAFSAAVLSSATSASMDQCDRAAWEAAMQVLSQQWSTRLEAID